ncbi:MAG: UMP kinase [Lentisphaerae bacterium RIFOXYB12_FULL_65_16]|nr:MAG: UMP kinase [Lentisphaerae bacterium RIFOXYA12_64_32]OGV88127.1 MAG: UMP kinase [Lentisphaerae bacterium RIFOXYB12_FULL_65_16]
MAKLDCSRVLLKLSGELLKGGESAGVDSDAVSHVAARVRDFRALGVELALVIGAGNIFRGLTASRRGMDRTCADYMGMLATVINALALREALENQGVPTRIQSAIAMTGIIEPFDQVVALDHLAAGRVLIFAAGTGHPFFTTDTTAALRACQIGAKCLFKATKVDGVYSADPKVNRDATRYRQISYTDALRQRLNVMDSTAFSLCMDNGIPIVVFDFEEKDIFRRIVQGDLSRATLVSEGETAVG